jgi:outer membrane lipoprotein-sorting protein
MLFLTFYSSELLATEKEKIIKKLKETRSISFNFTQKTNSVIENGWCILAFPNKLKCVYDDKKQKELILNNNTLSITQKRYDKTFLYPVSKSPFLKILDKTELINKIRKSDLENNKNVIKIIDKTHGERIVVFFDSKLFNIIGWEFIDQFNNNVSFSIKILTTNFNVDLNQFKHPKIN